MASFYNNYYRYYRGYPPHISNSRYSIMDKTPLKSASSPSSEDSSIPTEDLSTVSSASSGSTRSSSASNFSAFSEASSSITKDSDKEKKSTRFYSFGPIQFKNPLFDNIEEPIFEILGIKLYLDDIIILGLLFFLYQEGVQDEMLFIALILLLLS